MVNEYFAKNTIRCKMLTVTVSERSNITRPSEKGGKRREQVQQNRSNVLNQIQLQDLNYQ